MIYSRLCNVRTIHKQRRILIYTTRVLSTEKTEGRSERERVLPTIAATSTADRATSYVDAADPTASADAGATCRCVRAAC